MDKNTFSFKFPKRISSINFWKVIIVLVLLLTLSVILVDNDYHEGLLVIITIFLFYLVKIKINSIDKAIEICHRAINENKELLDKDKTNSNILITEDGKFIKSRNRIIFFYILAGIFFLVYLAIRSRGVDPLLKSVNVIIYLSALLTGLAVYDLKNIMRYFDSVLAKNKSKLSLFEQNKYSTPSWEHSIKKLNNATAIAAIVFLIVITLFFIGKLPLILLALLPAVYVSLLFLIIIDTKKMSNTSLIVLHNYDNAVKDKLDLNYAPTIQENALKTFIKTFKSEFTTKFHQRQRKSAKFIDKLKK